MQNYNLEEIYLAEFCSNIHTCNRNKYISLYDRKIKRNCHSVKLIVALINRENVTTVHLIPHVPT